MRTTVLFAALVCALILSACGGSPQPTATPLPPTQPPVPTGTTAPAQNNPVGTLAATIGVPQAGTLLVPAQGSSPNAPTAGPIVFDDLIFSRSGGITGQTLSIELHGDGTLIRDGQTSKVSQKDVTQIGTLLDGIDFFNLQGIFVGSSGAADMYRYNLTVTSGSRSRTITSEDNLTPPELNNVYNAVLNLGTSS